MRDLDPTNDLSFLRIRTVKHEIMVAPGRWVGGQAGGRAVGQAGGQAGRQAGRYKACLAISTISKLMSGFD